MEIPQGATLADTEIRVEAISSGDATLPAPPVGGALSRAFTFSPEGLRFLAPVTIRINYADSEVSGIHEEDLVPLLLVGDEWTGIRDCRSIDPLDPDPCLLSRDTENNTLTIRTTHFSTYGAGDTGCRVEVTGAEGIYAARFPVDVGALQDEAAIEDLEGAFLPAALIRDSLNDLYLALEYTVRKEVGGETFYLKGIAVAASFNGGEEWQYLGRNETFPEPRTRERRSVELDEDGQVKNWPLGLES